MLSTTPGKWKIKKRLDERAIHPGGAFIRPKHAGQTIALGKMRGKSL